MEVNYFFAGAYWGVLEGVPAIGGCPGAATVAGDGLGPFSDVGRCLGGGIIGVDGAGHISCSVVMVAVMISQDFACLYAERSKS